MDGVLQLALLDISNQENRLGFALAFGSYFNSPIRVAFNCDAPLLSSY
jgi:hypothetical protein